MALAKLVQQQQQHQKRKKLEREFRGIDESERI